MSGEINSPFVPISFDGTSQSMQMLIDFLQNNSTFLPPALLSAFLMQYLFTFPAQLPSMGQRQLVPMPEVQKIHKQINQTLLPLVKELEQTLGTFKETFAKAFPQLKLANGEKMIDLLPAFKALVKDLALLEPSESKPSDTRQQAPASNSKKTEPSQPKIPDMVGKAKLASEFMHHSNEHTTPAERFLGKLSNFMGHFESLMTEAKALFPHQQNTVSEMRDAFRHLEKAFTLVKEREQGEGRVLEGNKSEPLLDPLRKEFGKFLQDAFRPFKERGDTPRGEIRFMPSPKDAQMPRELVFNHNPRPAVKGEQLLEHFLKLFVITPQTTPPMAHQEGVPLGIIAPYSQNHNQDLKKKRLKEKKNEPKNRPYLRDLPYEEELE